MNSEPATFAGWHRKNKHQPWRRIVEAATEADCWDRLLNHALPSGEKCVVAADIDPNDKPAPNTARSLLP
jgi:hypothetical protein